MPADTVVVHANLHPGGTKTPLKLLTGIPNSQYYSLI
jgi:hypothetical protein